MGRSLALLVGCKPAGDDIQKRLILREALECTHLPHAEIFGNGPAFDRLAINTPGLPAASWRRTQIAIFILSILWPVPSAKRAHKSRDLTASLEASILHRAGH